MEDDDLCRCGACVSCTQRASRAITNYVVREQRRQRRSALPKNPRERRYVQGRVKMLLVMTGLMSEAELSDEDLLLSEWGSAMRARQM